jgi:leucyl aminopeptidase
VIDSRVPFSIVKAERVDAGPCVLLVTESGYQRLIAGGHPALTSGETANLPALAAGVRFQAKAGEQLACPSAARVLHLVGLGAEPSTRVLREAAAQATAVLPPGQPWTLLFDAGATGTEGVEAAIEGLSLGAYRFKLSVNPPPPPPGPCRVLAAGFDAALLARVLARAEGQLLTRDLVNTPADRLGPADLVNAARDVAERHGMRCRTLVGDEVWDSGFKLVATTGRAAERPPAVAIVECGPSGRAPDLALVGKGVVFDTGGLDIKTGGYMKLMRKDMGGAGTIIGALDALGRLGFDGSLLAVLPAAENAIGPRAMRPGDILDSMDGQKVEIGNTDAEGRLLLADGLAYARARGAKRILDVATLTGAARVALGPDVPALFGTDEELVQLLLDCSRRADEPVWRMPLVDGYEWMIDTPWADVNNSGADTRGGAITAALFLRRFAKDTPWAHVDLYAWEDRGRPGTPKGANGMFVRTLVRAVDALMAR